METLKTPSEYSVDFNCGFQGYSMANLEKGLTPLKYVLGNIMENGAKSIIFSKVF